MAERLFRTIYQQADDWVIASTPELPGAFGQGKTVDEAREDLRAAIVLMLEVVEDELLSDDALVIHREDLAIATA